MGKNWPIFRFSLKNSSLSKYTHTLIQLNTVASHPHPKIAENMSLNCTNYMVLVLFKNIHILPSHGQKMAHMPIFGHTSFGHTFFGAYVFLTINPTFLGKLDCIFFGAQETIIYRLVMRNPNYNACLRGVQAFSFRKTRF